MVGVMIAAAAVVAIGIFAGALAGPVADWVRSRAELNRARARALEKIPDAEV